MQLPISPSTWNFDLDKYVNPWLPPVPWKYVPRPIAHFFGHRIKHQKSLGNIVIIFWSFIGVFCSLVIIEAVGRQIHSFRDHQAPIIIGSFVRSSATTIRTFLPDVFVHTLFVLIPGLSDYL